MASDEEIRAHLLEIARSTDPNEDLMACFAVDYGTQLLVARKRNAELEQELAVLKQVATAAIGAGMVERVLRDACALEGSDGE
ncbi:MAG TPA: hypothetical protein VK509_10425 [Polyangiales bacterium]|nr:hypothetical protein [Polyangiales bacterium]